MKPEIEILEKNSKNGKYIKNIHLRYTKLKPGQNNLFRGLNRLRKEEKRTCGSHLKEKENKIK